MATTLLVFLLKDLMEVTEVGVPTMSETTKGIIEGSHMEGNPNNDQGKIYEQKSDTWNGNNKSRGSGSFHYWNDGEGYRNNFGLSSKCQICKKKGHIAINCWYRNDIPLSYPSNSMITCQICGLKGHAALDCRYRSTCTFQGAEPPSTPTVMTAHITNRASFSGLSSLVPFVAVPASVERGNTSGNVENHGGGGDVVVGGSENNSGGGNGDMGNNVGGGNHGGGGNVVVGGSENNSGGDNGDMRNNVGGGNIFEGDSGFNSIVGGDNGDMGNKIVGSNIFEGDIFEGDSGSNSTVGSSNDSSGSSGSIGIDENFISDIITNERILPQELQFVPDPATSYNNHSMLTRAKNGIFKKKSFDEFCAYSCIAQRNVLDELSFCSDLTSVLDIVDVAKHFKDVGHVEWENAMKIAVSICRFLFTTQLQLSCELQSAQDQASKQHVVPTRIKDEFDKKMSCQDLCAFSCVAPQKLKQEITYRHNDVFVFPEKYAKELVHDAGIDTSRSCSVPCESHLQVLKIEGSHGTLLSDLSLLRRIVDALQYLSFSRLDILFVANLVCQFLTAGTYVTSAKRMLRTVISTYSNLSLVTHTEIEGRC
uniref:uncharacterized protein LOC105350525 n=1 Tax=Fragaria vesca subsp. vesca TaxID=101020 RepID=UPI0005CA06B7|nr:PREDICTED: uncharacterized protein LOC105350525 [Fragaria vesca subsp. vesca]